MAGSHWPLPVHKVNVKWIQCESRWMLGNRLANTWYHRPLPSIRGHRNTATHNNTTPGNQVSEACRPTSTWAAALRGRLPSGVHVRRGNSTFCTCRPYGDYMEPETPDCSASPANKALVITMCSYLLFMCPVPEYIVSLYTLPFFWVLRVWYHTSVSIKTCWVDGQKNCIAGSQLWMWIVKTRFNER